VADFSRTFNAASATPDPAKIVRGRVLRYKNDYEALVRGARGTQLVASPIPIPSRTTKRRSNPMKTGAVTLHPLRTVWKARWLVLGYSPVVRVSMRQRLLLLMS
jgi:hypothetical protein